MLASNVAVAPASADGPVTVIRVQRMTTSRDGLIGRELAIVGIMPMAEDEGIVLDFKWSRKPPRRDGRAFSAGKRQKD